MRIASFKKNWIVICVFCLGLTACSDDEGGAPGITLPPLEGVPLVVADLQVTGADGNSIQLAWTSPELIAKTTGGIQYDLRYTLFSFLDTPVHSWAAAPAPEPDSESGVVRQYSLTGLSEGQTYAITLRSTADGQDWSVFALPVAATAAPNWDATPPAVIDDLSFWSSTPSTITIDWSPGTDDGPLGECASYEVRYGTTELTEGNWDQANLWSGDIVTAQDPDQLRTTISGLTEGETYFLGVRAVDDAGLLSPLGQVLAIEAGQSRTWYVNVEGTGDLPTIEAAVDIAGSGDEIVVGPGRYTWTNQGTGDFYGMILIAREHTGFTLRSELGPEETILDAENLGGVIHIQGYNDIVIEGFTITRGNVSGDGQAGEPYAGGGIVSHLGSPLIRDCIIRWNYASEGGGVWLGSTGQPVLENCLIENNEAISGGGVALVNDALHTRITGCTIRNNYAAVGGGALMAYNVFFTLEDCLITGNQAGQRGGAIAVSSIHDDCLVRGCTIADNVGAEGSAVSIYGNSVLEIQSSNLVFNTGGPAFSTQLSSGLAMGCSNVFGHPEGQAFPAIFIDLGNNFSDNPLFCGVGLYTLQDGSPCAPGNHPAGGDCQLVGSEPVQCASR